VPQTTLSRWLEEARSLPRVPPLKKSNAWTVEEKIKILAGAATLTGEQLSAFLEQHGVRLAEFEQWRLALDEEGRSSKAVTNRIRGLERELARKEKALAEAAALLILKKRLQSAFGVEDDDTDEGNEK
jgi:transposase